MKILLALGGGGPQGNAHIGILKAMERSGHQITAEKQLPAHGAHPSWTDKILERLNPRNLFKLDKF